MNNSISRFLLIGVFVCQCLLALLFVASPSPSEIKLSNQDVMRLSEAMAEELVRKNLSAMTYASASLETGDQQSNLNPELLVSMMAAVVGQELRKFEHNLNLQVTQEVVTKEEVAIQEVKPLTEEQLQQQEMAYQTTSALVDSAIANGVWTMNDSLSLLQQMSVLPPEELDDLRDRFFRAVNNQQVELESIPMF